MGKYVVFTEDVGFIEKLKLAFPGDDLEFRQKDGFPSCSPVHQLAIVDADYLIPAIHLKKIAHFKRRGIPVIFATHSITGKLAMHLLRCGVLAILFKDDSPGEIAREVRRVLAGVRTMTSLRDIFDTNTKLTRFMKVMQSLTSDRNIDELVLGILAAMKSTFGFTDVVFALAAEGTLKVKIALGEHREQYQTMNLPMGEKQYQRFRMKLGNKTPFLVSPRGNAIPGQFAGFSLIIPLCIKGKLIGLIGATLPASLTRKFAPREWTLIKAFAGQTSLAIENAKLYWDMIQAREELVNEEKKALLGQMIVSLNHEINNPLSIISMEAQLLQRKLDDSEGTVEARLQNIEANIERIKAILERISELDIADHQAVDYLGAKQMLNLQ